METKCSFPSSSPPTHPSNASVFPHLFFPITVCSSPLPKFWHHSLSLNKDDDKNLKPSYSHLKRDLVPDPTALCACVKRREARLCTLPAQSCSSPHAAGMESPISYINRNSLRFVGVQQHSPAIPNAVPDQSFCLLSHFSVAGLGIVGLTQRMCTTVGLQEPMHTDWIDRPALWPSAQVVCSALLNV